MERQGRRDRDRDRDRDARNSGGRDARPPVEILSGVGLRARRGAAAFGRAWERAAPGVGQGPGARRGAAAFGRAAARAASGVGQGPGRAFGATTEGSRGLRGGVGGAFCDMGEARARPAASGAEGATRGPRRGGEEPKMATEGVLGRVWGPGRGLGSGSRLPARGATKKRHRYRRRLCPWLCKHCFLCCGRAGGNGHAMPDSRELTSLTPYPNPHSLPPTPYPASVPASISVMAVDEPSEKRPHLLQETVSAEKTSKQPMHVHAPQVPWKKQAPHHEQ